MTELEYGINVANKFDLLFGDEDPSEALSKAQVDAKKKAKGAAAPATAASGNVLKEKTARSAAGAKAPATTQPADAKKVDNKKPGTQQDKTRTVPTGGAQQQGQQQRPPRSAPQGARPEQGKENTTNTRAPKTEGGQQRSPAGGQGGQRRFGGPRPEGSAPPRRPYNDQQGGDFGGAMTGGDQEVPEQRVGFGGRGGYRGGASYRGGRASPRHPYPRDQQQQQQQGVEGGAAPSHARGREYERHSGSNKTGVKPVAKREGGGSYNWGSYRDEAEIGTETAHGQAPTEGTPVKAEGAEGAVVEGAVVEGEAVPAEPESKEKTLKEWLEEEERNRVRPKYTTRQANEGESEQKVFQKMRRVQREKANADGMVEVVEYVEVDVDDDNHGASSSGKGGRGGPFQLVFAPAQRTDGPSSRGGPRGGARGAGRGGPRGGAAPFQGGRGGGQRSGPGGRQAPPAVDELNFPALG